MIGLSTRTFDLAGAILLREYKEETDIDELTRRITRLPTLDGAAYINDGGYSASDRVMSVIIRDLNKADTDILRNITKNYSTITICTEVGAFLGNIDSFNINRGRVTVTLLISAEG